MNTRPSTSRPGMIAIDQYGIIFKIKGVHPRIELCTAFGTLKAEKMYQNDGEHIGYIIAGHWLKLYTITEWVKK